MNLTKLLILYCEQQEADSFGIEYQHQRNDSGNLHVSRVTVSVHFNLPWGQRKEPEFIDFEDEDQAIIMFQTLTKLNKALA